MLLDVHLFLDDRPYPANRRQKLMRQVWCAELIGIRLSLHAASRFDKSEMSGHATVGAPSALTSFDLVCFDSTSMKWDLE